MAQIRGKAGSRDGANTQAAENNLSVNGSEPIHVLVVDDHQLFRMGLQELLEREGLKVVGVAADGESALELVVESAPDVVLMDLELPGMSGVDATRRIAEIAPRTRVLVLTISAEEQNVVDTIVAGACGYLLKGTSIEMLVASIEAAVAGESMISNALAAKLFERIRTEDGANTAGRAAYTELSEREIEILGLVASGKGNTEIAEELVISPHTVRNHVSNILAKLHMHSRLEAAVFAIRNRVV